MENKPNKDELIPGDSYFHEPLLGKSSEPLFSIPSFDEDDENISPEEQNRLDDIVKKDEIAARLKRQNRSLPRKVFDSVYEFVSDNGDNLLYVGSPLAISIMTMDQAIKSSKEDTLSTLFYSFFTIATAFSAGVLFERNRYKKWIYLFFGSKGIIIQAII